jgi:hypothetical protein
MSVVLFSGVNEFVSISSPICKKKVGREKFHIRPLGLSEFHEKRCRESPTSISSVNYVLPEVLLTWSDLDIIRFTRRLQKFLPNFKFRENQYNESRTLFRSIYEFLSLLSTCIVQAGPNSMSEICTKCCWSFVSAAKIGGGNAALLSRAWMKLHLGMYRETFWYLENKECLGDIFALHH